MSQKAQPWEQLSKEEQERIKEELKEMVKKASHEKEEKDKK